MSRILLAYTAFVILLTTAGFLIGTSSITLGASLPSATASFETSLQSAITSSATTMTLTANAVRGGGALSGYNCFTVDEGSAQAETICGTVSGTSVTALSRGISQLTGTTTVSALQFAHRRGANVKITDFPVIQILKAQNNGQDTFPNLLLYAVGTACSGSSPNGAICDKAYMDALAIAGASNANETTKGIVELATQIESASSTATGSTAAALALQSKYATSSPYTPGLWTVITQNDGTINPLFIATSSAYTYTIAASSTFKGIFNLTGTTSIMANSLTNGVFSINNLPLKFPTVAPTATSSYAIDASGNVTYRRPDGMLLASTTLTSATASTTLTIGATSTDLRIIIDIPSFSSAIGDIVSLQFNSDTGNNYGWAETTLGGTATNQQSCADIQITAKDGTSPTGRHIVLDISNRVGFAKSVIAQSEIVSIAANSNDGANGRGTWGNTTQSINTITIGTLSQLPINTRISVYGSSQ